MLKKLLIGVGVLIIILVLGNIYLSNRNRTLSPPGNVQYTSNEMMIEVDYSRPSVRDRVIFGTEEEGALQPYGQYWRLGANEGTEIEFSRDVMIGENLLKKGRYRIYAVPGPETFEIYFNTELGDWGYFEPDHDQDLFYITANVNKTDPFVEQFTIFFTEEGDAVNVVLEFGEISFRIPVKAA